MRIFNGTNAVARSTRRARAAGGLCLLGTFLAWSAGCGPPPPVSGPVAPRSEEVPPSGVENLLDGYPAIREDGLVNVVVEIPAGTNAKWQVRKSDGALEWELKNGTPRVVQYLAYPANYGMIPRTILPREEGGDGDPLDVVLLGPAEPRGSVARARVVGVLRMNDGGEQDDKLLAVSAESPFALVRTMPELETAFPGVVEILTLWFENYKGPGEIDVWERGSADEALRILEIARRAFERRVH